MSKNTKNTKNVTSAASDLIETYSELLTPGTKDNVTDFLMKNIYLCHHKMHKAYGYTPYNPDIWESHEHIMKKSDKEDKSIKKKSDKKDDSKSVKLKHPTTFKSDAKIYLMAILIKMVDEASLVNDEIMSENLDQQDEIKKKISEHASENSEDYISPMIFRICDSYDNKILGDTLPTSGITLSKLKPKLEKFLKENEEVQNVIMSEFSKFLRLLAVHISSNLWNEAKYIDPTKEIKKKSDDDDDDKKSKKDKKTPKEPYYEPSSKSTTEKIIKQFIMTCNVTLCPSSDKISNNQLDYLFDFNSLIQAKEDKKKKENKDSKENKENGKDKKSAKSNGKKSSPKKKDDSDHEDDANESDNESDNEKSDNESDNEKSDNESDIKSDNESGSESDSSKKNKKSAKKLVEKPVEKPVEKSAKKSIKPKEAPEPPAKKGKNRKNSDA